MQCFVISSETKMFSPDGCEEKQKDMHGACLSLHAAWSGSSKKTYRLTEGWRAAVG